MRNVADYYKVPFRDVYCDTFAGWMRQTFWCHVVIRVFPKCHDFGSDALVPLYRENPAAMAEQLDFLLR